MSTTRTIRTGNLPVVLDADLTAIDLHVYTEARSDGEVTVSTVDNDGPSTDAVRGATLDVRGNQLTVRLDHTGGMAVIQTGRGGTVQTNSGSGVFVSGNNYSNVVVGNGTVMVNGRLVSGGAGSSPVTVVARLPHGSSVRAKTQSGDINLEGVYHEVDASSQSGNVEVGTAKVVQARTQSGNVEVLALTGSGALESMSGDIEVRGPQGASASARTMSGDVRSSGGIRVAGSSMSGRVRT
jgi:hypothetical protein